MVSTNDLSLARIQLLTLLPLNFLARFFDKVAETRAAVICVGAVALFAGMAIFPLIGDSCTFDEGTHLAAGYTYLLLGDFRMSIDNPPLSKVFGALPLLFQPVLLPEDGSWARADLRYEYAFKLLYQCGNDPAQLLFWSRLANLFWGVILLLSVYSVTREFGGRCGALITLLLAAFCPILLAHGHLITPDIGVTTLFFLTVVSFWKLLTRGPIRWALYCGGLLGGALATKHNALLLLPSLGAMLSLRTLIDSRLCVPQTKQTVTQGLKSLWLTRCRTIGAGLLIAGSAYAVIWGIYGFRFKGSTDPSFEYGWTVLRHNKGAIGNCINFARSHQLLPEAHLFGLALVVENTTNGQDAYALGKVSQTGWWWYFPFALLVKIPSCAWLLVILAGCCIFKRRKLEFAREYFLLVIPACIFLAFLMTRDMNIGVRHAMPILPFLWTFAGSLGKSLSGLTDQHLWRKGIAALLIVGCIVETASAAPHFLGFFNWPSRVLAHRHTMLVDSNLDWGQDLGRLKRYLEVKEIPEIKLAYFGAASPRHLRLNHQYLPSFNVYLGLEPEWKEADLAPGDVVGISATTLMGVYTRNSYLHEFVTQRLEPLTVIGTSIHLFKVRANKRDVR